MENMGGENSHRDEARFMMEIFDDLYQTRGEKICPYIWEGFRWEERSLSISRVLGALTLQVSIQFRVAFGIRT